ncbi:MotE family protein [Pontibaca salina]
MGMSAGPAVSAEPDENLADPSSAEVTAEQGALDHNGARSLLTLLQERERNLDIRERQIEDREKALQIADSAIKSKLAALVNAEENLRATVALVDGASENDLTKLTTVYEKMKPRDAAALFEEMVPEFAAGFLVRMRPESAAGILSGLSPDSAYAVSVILAGRNANAPSD